MGGGKPLVNVRAGGGGREGFSEEAKNRGNNPPANLKERKKKS